MRAEKAQLPSSITILYHRTNSAQAGCAYVNRYVKWKFSCKLVSTALEITRPCNRTSD